jgi:hypothetical protein
MHATRAAHQHIVRNDGRTNGCWPGCAPPASAPNASHCFRTQSFLIAELGHGGVCQERGRPDSDAALMEIDGRRLEPTNFVGYRRQGTHLDLRSTPGASRAARAPRLRRRLHHLIADKGAASGQRGIGFTNEVSVEPGGGLAVRDETSAAAPALPDPPDGCAGAREVFSSHTAPALARRLRFDAAKRV